MTHPPVGIDLGTTHSVLAVWSEQGPVALDLHHGDPLLPSVVSITQTGDVLVGRAARARLTTAPEATRARFKPDMGSDRVFTLGVETLGATSLSAFVLRELREAASEALGLEVVEAVVTVPAWFGEKQRRATLDAARLAGLSVRRLVNEPTAAALAYGIGLDAADHTVAVLDLGGGTFDVTLIEVFDGVVEVLSSVGDVHLGGEDVTEAFGAYIHERLPPDARPDRPRLLELAEGAKRALSRKSTVTLRATAEGPSVVVTRDELESVSTPLLRRLARCVREALVQAERTAASIDHVVLVGGATRMPAVRALAQELFGRPPRTTDVDVDLLVAHGAATQAALVDRHEALREILVTDVLTHSLGIAVQRRWGDQVFPDRFSPVLPRGTTLPASRSDVFTTLHPSQTRVTIRVFEGEQREATRNTLLGTMELLDLPVHEDPDGRTEFRVRFTHDVSGLLDVEATVLQTGQVVRTVIDRGVAELSPEARAEAEQTMARLRTPPRELLPNRLLLERASRVHAMLPPRRAADLDLVLTAFEAALEREDPEEITRVRETLAPLVDDLVRTWELDPWEGR